MTSREQVLEELKKCIDPELGINIVDLGFVYGVKVDGGKVEVEMTLTCAGCPMGSFFAGDVEEKIRAIKGVEDVNVKIVFDPPWTPDRMTEEAKKQLGMG